MTTDTAMSAPARAAAGAELAIEAHDLVKTYPKGVRALDGLSFSVPAGTVFALLGPNGAGKSTTVKILTTLAQADSGTAVVAGLDVRARPARVRHVIGVVAQLSGADPVATGRENVLLSGRIQGLRGRDLARRADDLLGRFGLAEAAGRRVRTYSGGMRRRLDVAMGLVNRPEVLFLDEPTAGLDPESRSAMWEEIARLAAAEGLTILLTTHYLEEADQLASRLAIVDRGRVVVTGTPDELKGELHGEGQTIMLTTHYMEEADRLSQRVAIMDRGRILALDTPAALKQSIGADTIVMLKTTGDAARLAELLAKEVEGVARTRVSEDKLELHMQGADRLVPRVVLAAEREGFDLVDVSIAEPTLETVFISLTGKELRD